ncbi:MAG: DivIVA domain-containing protein [Nocardiopsaceae bacterium]|jgi:DivIVA domain-containing protein|nr:DivIVA domain-containing protein [Nocardiopsaceae bacterium]
MTIAWQDEQKRLTPDDVQSASFPLSRLGRRGCDEEHVRAFLREVEHELVTLLNEKVSLWNEVERLRRRIITGMKSGDDGGVLFGREDAHVHAVRILSNAQLTADRYVADAQAYSHRLTEEARSRRDEILTEAQRHADTVLAEAQSRAREAALATLNAPAAAPAMEANRSALQAELAYLRTFGEVYRTHLRAYTEGMLRSIAEWERSEAGAIEQASAEARGSVSLGQP